MNSTQNSNFKVENIKYFFIMLPFRLNKSKVCHWRLVLCLAGAGQPPVVIAKVDSVYVTIIDML